MYLKNIPTVVIPALSPYSLNYTKMLATWGTSGLKEHGSSLLENAKNVDFWRFFPVCPQRKKTAWLLVLCGNGNRYIPNDRTSTAFRVNKVPEIAKK